MVVAREGAAEVAPHLDAMRRRKIAVENRIKTGAREPSWLAETADLIAYLG